MQETVQHHRVNQYLHKLRLASRCFIAVALVCAQTLPLMANPIDGLVSAGSADIASSGSTLTVTQQTDKAVIDWRGFDIAHGETTNFVQPSASSMTLNRVNSNAPSFINGNLNANGNLIVVNPNGVWFGAGARVDVNGLVASTADIGNNAFMNSTGILDFNIAGDPDATIVNDGLITAKEAGLVGLVAPNVINRGVILAKLGRVALASGDTATVDMYGDGLIKVAVSDDVKSQLVSNSGIIGAAGGTIALTAAAGKNIVNSLISVTGELSAPSVSQRNGKIIIAAQGSNKTSKQGSSTVLVSGILNASGRNAGERGGSIVVTGDNVGLLNGARIDVSGSDGLSGTTAGRLVSAVRHGSAGGDIRIGGDYLGQGDTPTALNLYVDSGALILNDAINSGDAGRTIFWSDGLTQFYGNVYARALGGKPEDATTWHATSGGNAGDGGFVETSGHIKLDAGGYVDLTASNGPRGTYFLDPTNITIYGNFAPNYATVIQGDSTALSANLKLWLDAADTTKVNLTYSNNALSSATATGTIGTNTITTSVNVASNLAVGARIRLGSAGAVTAASTMGADTYTISAIAGTTITLTSNLTSTYTASTLNRGLVSTWVDKSTSANNATQAASSSMPLFVSNSVNGLSTIRTMSATQDYLDTGALGIGSTSGISVFASTLANTFTSGANTDGAGSYFWDRIPVSNDLFGLKSVGGKYTLQVRYNDGSGLTGISSTTSISSTPVIVSMFRNYGVTNSLGINGAIQASIVDSAKALTPQSLRIGTHQSAGNALDAQYLDNIWYDRTLSTNAQALVNQYQSAKWAIQLTPPGSGVGETAQATASIQKGDAVDGYSVFTAQYLERLSQSANISLQASNNITLDLQGDTMNFATSGRTLTLTAGNQITTASAGSITTNNGAINLTGTTGGIAINNNFTLNSGGGAININSPTAIATGATFTVNDGGSSNTIASVISGAGGLTKAGSGTLTVTGTNTYTGATTVTAGTLQIGSAGSLGAGNYAGAISVATGSTFRYSSSAAQTLSGIISGAGALTKDTNGASTLILTGANTYTGATTISAGTLQVGNGGAAGSIASSTSIVNNSNLTYSFGTSTSVATPLNYSGTGNLSLTAGMVWYPANLSVGGNLTINSTTNSGSWLSLQTNINPTITVVGTTNITGFLAGVSGGTNTLTFNSTGAITLNNITNGIISNFWNWGTLNFNAGTSAVNVTGSSAMTQNNFNTTWNLTGIANITGNISSLTGATNTLNINDTANSTISGVLSGATILRKSGANLLTVSGTNTYTAATNINAGTLQIGSAGSLGSGSYAGAIVVASGASFRYSSSAAQTLSGIISGAGAVTKDISGASTLTLSGANTYTGGTNINAGILNLGSLGAIGSAGTISFGGGTLQYSASNTTDYSARFNTGGSQPWSVDTNGQNVTYATALAGTGSTLTKLGSGILSLTAVNTYTGATTVSAGTLQIGSAGSLGSGNYAGAIAVATGSTFRYSSSAAQTLSGIISGAGALTKDTSGASILTLSGANTYTGTSTVSTGTVTLSGSLNVGAGTVTTSVASGATLNGAGVITSGALNHSGVGTFSLTGNNLVGTLSATGTVGALTFNNAQSLTLSAITASTMNIQTTGVNSKISLTGALSASATSGNGIVLNAGNEIATTVANTMTTSGSDIILTGANGIGLYHATTLTSSGGNISFNSPLYLGAAQNISAGTGIVTFASTVDSLNQLSTVNTLVVAGGGGGGGGTGGGGGAGGLLNNTNYAVTTGASNTVTVGTGGAAGAAFSNGLSGTNSVFGTLTAIGGGGGGANNNINALSGGSGGGGAWNSFGAAGTVGQGNAGAAGASNAPNYGAGGGGGAGSSGTLGSTTTGGNGGAGISNSITGSAVTYAGGGGGGVYQGGTLGTGGLGGGGNGGSNILSGVAGTNGLGGGGGGAGNNTANGGAGGTGTVIVRYTGRSGQANIVGNATSATVGNDTVWTYTGSGSFTANSVGCVGGCGLTVNAATINMSGGIGGTTALGAVSLTSANSMTLPAITASTVTVQTTGTAADITLGGNITANATSGDSIKLVAGKDLNNAAARTLNVAGTARWLVYSGDTADATIVKGSLTGFNRYGCAYNAGSPSCVGGTNIPTSGNGFYFANTPILTITPNSISNIVYGSAAPNLSGYTYTRSGYQSVADSSADTVTGTLSGSSTYIAGSGINTYNINYGLGSLSSALGYGFTYANNASAFNVTARPITITADAKTKVYGALDPSLTYQITTGSLYTGDNFTGALSRTLGESVTGGPYAIGQNTLTAGGNYNISYTGNNLSITPATLTITAAAKTKVYGALDPTLTYGVAGLTNGDTSSVISGALARVAGENVTGGPYAINQNTLSAGGNYSISYTGNNLSITPATLTITAAAKTKVYGALDPTLTYGVAGLTNGDTASVISGALARVVGENVGSYGIGQNTLTAGGNYTVSYTGDNLSITPATLTITAAAKTKVYGALDPTLTYGVAGLTNGDTASVISGALARVAGENVTGGPYAINQNTLSAGGNYSISYTGNNLSITPATLTITAAAKTKVYGALDPTLTYGVAGLTNGDTSSVISGALSRTLGESVTGGPYAINQNTLTAGSNYSISYSGNNLSITPATLTITAAAKTKVYGALDPTLTYGVAGLTNGDTSSVITGALARVAGETVLGGPYAINKNTLSAGNNYTLTYTGNSLSISRAALTIDAIAQSKLFGSVDPTLTYAVSGLVNGDTNAILTGNLSRALGETVGAYGITRNTLSASDNYTIAYNGNILTINPALTNSSTNTANKAAGNDIPVTVTRVSQDPTLNRAGPTGDSSASTALTSSHASSGQRADTASDSPSTADNNASVNQGEPTSTDKAGAWLRISPELAAIIGSPTIIHY